MKIALIAGVIFLFGVAVGFLLNLCAILFLRRRLRKIRAGQEKAPSETMKRVVWACVINGFAWVWCSYILAALGRMQIAEELSKVALAEIVVPVGVYALKSVVENLSKNNHWPDRMAADPENEESVTEGENPAVVSVDTQGDFPMNNL